MGGECLALYLGRAVRDVTIKFPECPRKSCIYVVAYTLMVAVIFEAVSLCTYIFTEFCQKYFWNALQNNRRVSLNVGSVRKSVAIQTGLQFLGIAKSRAG